MTELVSTDLAPWSTFRLGGSCRGMIHCQTEDQARSAHQWVRTSDVPYFWIGGGSNLLISDQGVDAVVLRYVSEVSSIQVDDEGMECCAAMILDDVCQELAERGVSGLNFCSGIPGTLGGGIVGNAGAWGKQLGDVLEWVDYLYPDGREERLTADQLGFQYRHSELKTNTGVILRARFWVEKTDAASLLEERSQILTLRSEKHPNLEKEPCIGSFFRNIEPSSAAERRQAAGWFLEQAGAPALCVGGARVFKKHANIIVAGEGCTAEDVYSLSRKMQDAVRSTFGFALVREIRLVGPFSQEPVSSPVFFH